MEINYDEILKQISLKNVIGVKTILNSFVYSYYQDIKERFINGEDVSKHTPEIEKILLGLDFIYISGDISPLKDSEYDDLYNIFTSLTGRYLTNKNENTKAEKREHVYPKLKGTIKKVHHISEAERIAKKSTRKSLEKFILNAIKTYGISGKEYSICFYPKFDGVSVIFEIENNVVKSAITRGDAETGLGTDVTSIFGGLAMDCSLVRGNYGMKSEIVLTKKQFKEFSKKYSNDTRKLEDPRSAASCIISSSLNFPKDWINYITIIPLAYSFEDNLIIPTSYVGKNLVTQLNVTDNLDLKGLDKVINGTMRDILDNELDIKCDGIVIRFNDSEMIEKLGRDEEKCINNFEVAFKYEPPAILTKLENIEFSVGLMGKISAVGKVTPVNINNRTIKSVSLNSIDRFKALSLHKDETVEIKYDIIPYLEKHYGEEPTGEKFELIDTCPYCNTLLEYKPELMCVNTNCMSRIMGKIYNYCNKIGIDNIGEQTVEDFFIAGLLMSIEDIYRLESNIASLINLEGYGVKKINNIIDSINSKRTVEASKLLGSLGIPSIGRKMFEKVTDKIPFRELISFTEKDIPKLTEIQGIKETTAIKIIDGIRENLETIMFLEKNLNLVSETKKEFEGTVVFTNVRNKKFEEHLESKCNLKVADSVNKKTLYVITDSQETVTGKITKARELQIPVLTIGEAYEYFNY